MNKVKVTLNDASITARGLRPIDDTFMQKLGEDLEFCQELLQVAMDNPHLKVISCSTQKALHNIDTRSVTIDIKCEDEDGTIFAVEVQKANDDDHQKRVRYNSSCVQIQSLEKGASFKELPDLYMIFITEKDFLKKERVIYHIDRVIRETGEVISNGYQEIYINAQIDDGTDLAEYMKILKSETVCNNSKFPVICNLTNYYKNGNGSDNMCQAVEDYAKEYAERYAKEYAKEQMYSVAEKFILIGNTDTEISGATGLSIEEVSDIRSNLQLSC